MLCKKVIHVNSPAWSNGSPGEAIQNLESAVFNIMELADNNNLSTIALPSIGSGG